MVHRGQALGALVVQRQRPAQAQPRQGTTVVRMPTDPELDEGPRAHEFVGAAAGQLATAIANARLYEEAVTMGARLSVVIAGFPDAVVVFDRADRCLFYNPKMQEMYGLEGVDITGWTPPDFVREIGHCHEDPSIPLEISRRIAECKDQEHRITFVLTKPKRRVIERISVPVLTRDGEWFGQVVLYHDLTALHDASATLRAMP
jgi:PAS domain S-box-containing protein